MDINPYLKGLTYRVKSRLIPSTVLTMAAPEPNGLKWVRSGNRNKSSGAL